MKVLLDKIGPEGYDLAEELTPGWLAENLGSDSPFRPDGVGHIDARLVRMGEVVVVTGRVRVTMAADCVRCLERASLALNSPIAVTLFPKGQEPAAADDGELSADSMSVAAYEADEIDVGNVVRDEVFLELPMSPVCREGCAGLCAMCGTNLNEGACGCSAPIDPRWAALQQLKKAD